MSEHELLRYNELYVLCWRLMKKGIKGAAEAKDQVKYWNDFRAEGQAIYEKFMDLGRDHIYNIVNSTVIMTENAYGRQDQEVSA